MKSITVLELMRVPLDLCILEVEGWIVDGRGWLHATGCKTGLESKRLNHPSTKICTRA